MKYKKDFLDKIKTISQQEGWRDSVTFGNFLTSAACALNSTVLKLLGADDLWQKNEDRYMAIVNATKDGSTMEIFAEMLGIVALALEENDKQDFLGPIFQEIYSNKNQGQFFTPWDVALLTAKMTIGENPKEVLENAKNGGRDFILLQEPAVGAGSMVLAANQVLREGEIDVPKEAHWECWDIDWGAVCATYIQLALTNTSATVVHGNTLTHETYNTMFTPAAVMYPKWEKPDDGGAVSDD